MVGILVRAVTLLNEVEKIRDLLKTSSVMDAAWQGKQLLAAPTFNYKVQFFSNFEPTNFTADLANNNPNLPFAVSTGVIYRSQYDGQLYIQAQLIRKIASGYLNDWDNETVWVRALDVLVTKPIAQKKSNTGLIIAALAFVFLLNQK